VQAEVWKDRTVAAAFLNERALIIPDRPRQLEVMLRVAYMTSRPIRTILDMGCGDALLLAAFLEAFPDASGTAVDFSPHMLEQARTRLLPFGNRAAIVETDLAAAEWQYRIDGPFDLVISGFAIHHLPDTRKRALYGEVYGLLAEGGVFINAEHVASATPRIEQLFVDAMADHLYQRRRDAGESVTPQQAKRDLMERPDRAANILALVEVQCGWLRELGFTNVDCFWKYFELAIFGGTR